MKNHADALILHRVVCAGDTNSIYCSRKTAFAVLAVRASAKNAPAWRIFMTYIAPYILLIGLILLLLPIKYILCFFIFTGAFPQLAFYIFEDGNFIRVYHVVFLFLFVKYCFGRKKYYKPSGIIWFMIYALISIPLAFLNTHEYVVNIDDKLANVFLSFQQITQYTYLLLGFFSLYMVYSVLREQKISVNELVKSLMIAFFLVFVLGIVQICSPEELFDFFIRNGFGTRQYLGGRVRMSATFSEPSMLGFFCLMSFPIAVMCFRNRIFKACCFAVIFFVAMFSNSTTLYVGICACMFAYIVAFLARKDCFSKENVVKGISALCILCVICFVFGYEIQDVYISVSEKIKGLKTFSGIQRKTTLLMHWNVFQRNFIFGIGFGTIRSYDLLTTWLAEMGIIGFGIYCIYIGSLCFKLLKQRSEIADALFVSIVACNLMMMVSVSEPYYVFIWIVYALGEYVAKSGFVPEKTAIIRHEGPRFRHFHAAP